MYRNLFFTSTRKFCASLSFVVVYATCRDYIVRRALLLNFIPIYLSHDPFIFIFLFLFFLTSVPSTERRRSAVFPLAADAKI